MPYERDPRFLDLFDVRQLGARLQSGLNFSVQVSFLLLLALLAAGSWLNFRHTQLLFGHQTLVAHTHEVIGEVRTLLATQLDAESAVRAYVISGSEDYLGPYTFACTAVAERLDKLEAMTADNPPQQALVHALRSRSQLRLEHLDRIVASGRSSEIRNPAAIVSNGEGKRLMDSVRELIAQIESSENELLVTRSENARGSYKLAQITGLAVGVVGVFLVMLLYQLVRRFDRLRSKAAREASDAHERFRVTLGSIGDAVLVTDAEGRLTFSNQSGGALLAVPLGAIGKHLDEVFTFVSETTGERSASVVTRARETRSVARTPTDTALKLPDGRSLPVSATAATIFDRKGNEQGVVLVVRDVTDRRERERALARSNERFRSLVLAMSQIVWTMDAEGFVREDSPSWRQLTGQTYEQWKGQGWLEVVHPDDREDVLQRWKAAVESELPYQVEYRLRRADGAYYWTMVRAVPVRDLDGRVREWVGMNHDIQARKEAEEAERDAHQRKDEFIALLAHELRNPLAPIRNGLEILKTGDPEDATHVVGMMDRQLGHMVRLIDDLLDVSRITHGKLELRVERIDLRDVVRHSIDAARPAIQAKQQHLFVKLPPMPLWVEGDPVRLTQVVTNLLNNAIKYSAKEASIWVTAEREGARQLVIVRDTGQGIPTELKPRIWDLFLQGSGRVERVGGGLGLGLTLVKRLVEMHHGTVELHSEGLGAGSEFRVRLLASAAPPAAHVQPRTGLQVANARALRILVIDDNEDSAESLSMLLRVGRHDVRTVYHGEAGLEECVAFDPEVILCDIRMPGMTGFEFARQLRSNATFDAVLLVALTGFGTDADRTATSAAGFDRHLVKPVDPDALAKILVEAMHRADARRSGSA